jgi:predicted porin
MAMKKLVAAAVLAAVTPLAVAADGGVVVYGKVHVSVDSNDYDEGDDYYGVASRASRLGFKGSEDLGNGLKAIWQYEVTYSVDGAGQSTSGTGFGSARNSYLGLASDWGTVLVGRHDTPTKVAYYAADVEELGDSILDLNEGANAPAQLFKEFRANNAIAYISPSFAGFTFAGAMVPGEAETGGATDCRDTCDGIADHWSVAAMYGGYGFKGSIGYEVKDFTYTGYDEKIWQFGGSYTMNAFKIGGMYQDVQDVGGSIGVDQSAWAVVGGFTFGNNEIIAQYGERDLDNADDADTWGLGFNHMFSKRTSAYAAYATADEGSDGGDNTQWSLGMIHNF